MEHDPLGNGDDALLRLIERRELGQDGIVGVSHDFTTAPESVCTRSWLRAVPVATLRSKPGLSGFPGRQDGVSKPCQAVVYEEGRGDGIMRL